MANLTVPLHDAHLRLGNAYPNAIRDLDLSSLKQQYLAPVDVPRAPSDWGTAEIAYRRFLTLIYFYPNKALSPPPEAELVWRAHILDTRAYRRDCETLFGRFVDYPAVEGDSAADLADNAACAREAFESLYEKHFGSASGIRAKP